MDVLACLGAHSLRRRCCDVNQSRNHLFLSIWLFGFFGLNKGTGVIRADGDEHDGKVPNTLSKNREIWVFLVCCRCSRNLMAARERFCRFSVEIFTRVRAWELVYNFHRIETTHPRRAVWFLTFSNHKSNSRENSKWNIRHGTCFVVFKI